MPTPYHKLKPKDRYTLGEAAAHKQMLAMRCLLCRRPGQVFLATDLLQLFAAERDAYAAYWPCGKCGSTEWVRVDLRTAFDVDVGKLVVRRLVGIRRTPVWKNVPFGEL